MHSTRSSRPSDDRYEDVPWDRSTFHLPKKVQQENDLSPAEKHRHLVETENSLDAASAPSLTKFNVFLSRFNHDSLATEVNGGFLTLFNASQGFGGPVQLTAMGATFTFSDPVLRGSTGNVLAMNQGVPLAAPTRNAARYLTFSVTVDARAAYSGRPDDAVSAQLPTHKWSVGTDMPTVTTAAGVTSLHHALDTDVLRNVRDALNIIQGINNSPPAIGFITRPTGAFSPIVSVNDYREEFMAFYHDARFRMLKVLMKREFVGPFVQGTASIQQDLMKIRQFKYDPKTRTVKSRSINEYHIEFTATLNLHPTTQPYSFDPCVTFWSNANQDTQDAALADNWTLPPPPPGETNERALERLRIVKTQAEAYERRQQNTQKLINRSGRTGYRGSSRAQAFLSIPNAPWGVPPDDPDPAALALAAQPYDEQSALFDAGPNLADPNEIFEQAEIMAATHMSVCEDSMRRATGMPVPPTECWGCTKHPQFHETRFHRFAECPNKNDPVVRANKAAALKEFLEKRNRGQSFNPCGPAAAASVASPSVNADDWEAQGYPSKKMATLVATIAAPETSPVVRKSLCRSLTGKREAFATQPEKARSRAVTKRSRGDDDQDPVCLLCCPVMSAIKIMESVSLRRQFSARLGVTQSMPHIRFPVGHAREALVELMVDSCAGLNLGKLSYHKSIHEGHPEHRPPVRAHQGPRQRRGV